MHSDLDLLLYIAFAAGFFFAFGWLACAIILGARIRLDAQQLAERADDNGRQLMVIARGLRGLMGPLVAARPQLDEWAGDLERVAVAHLECVNAIGIDALHAVRGDQAQYLGEFAAPRRGAGALDFCDAHYTWRDHAPGCARAEPAAGDHLAGAGKMVGGQGRGAP